ncbi:hypothetical protein ROHU_017251 [Labeo rohita]|uniref:Uncharacterized protein n=1 Tax=Labeo rohita TaxID=84645 RepID=A0A498NH78_LABRO|nr:hypothetical protein ROHU_012206 [Labeo rohita]RXN31179.1 hypothetical protein ROHU_017251 [Labeo rohita]
MFRDLSSIAKDGMHTAVVSGAAQQDRLQLRFLNAARRVCLQRCAQVGREPWAPLEIRLSRRRVDAGDGEHRLEEIKKENPEGASRTRGLWDENGWLVEIVSLVVQMSTGLIDRELQRKEGRRAKERDWVGRIAAGCSFQLCQTSDRRLCYHYKMPHCVACKLCSNLLTDFNIHTYSFKSENSVLLAF